MSSSEVGWRWLLTRGIVPINISMKANASLNSKGEIIHPRIAETHARIHNALDSARRELEKGDLVEASKDINIAIEYARRLTNDLGR